MIKIKSFNQFLNEWNLKDHWEKERGDRKSPLSRISPFSKEFLSGWECDEFIELDKYGKPLDTQRISYAEFKNISMLKKYQFDEKVSFTLESIVNNNRVKRVIYDENFHYFVNLGKISFQIKNRFFCPVFKSRSKSGSIEYSPGECVWGVVKDNWGNTFIFKPEILNVNDFDKHLSNPHNLMKKFSHLNLHQYKQNILRLENLNGKNFSVIITENDNWLELVKIQTDTGKSLYELNPEIKIEVSKEEREWKNLFKKNVFVVFDNGTEIYQNGNLYSLNLQNGKDTLKIFKSKKEIEILLKGNNGVNLRKVLKPEDSITIISAKDNGERKLGGFNEEAFSANAKIAKTFKIQSISIINSKITLKGEIKDIFIVLSNGDIIKSKYSLK